MSNTQNDSDQHSSLNGLSLLTTDSGPLLHVEGCQFTGPGVTREPTTTERRTCAVCGRCQKELDAGRRCFGTNLDEAMRFFGTHVSAQTAIRQTFAALDHDLLWVPPSKAYIAVRRQGRAAAWVHHGHIGISGGQRVEQPEYRERSRSGSAAVMLRRGVICPQCHREMPLNGVCDEHS